MDNPCITITNKLFLDDAIIWDAVVPKTGADLLEKWHEVGVTEYVGQNFACARSMDLM